MKKSFRPKSSSPSKPTGRSAHARPYAGKPAKNQDKRGGSRSPDRESRPFDAEKRPKRNFSGGPSSSQSSGKPFGKSGSRSPAGYASRVEPLDAPRNAPRGRRPVGRDDQRPVRGSDQRPSRGAPRAEHRVEHGDDQRPTRSPARSFANKKAFTTEKPAYGFAKGKDGGKRPFKSDGRSSSSRDKPAFGFRDRDSDKRTGRTRTPKNHAQREGGRPHETAARVYGVPANRKSFAKNAPKREIAASSYVASGNNVLLWGLHAVRAALLNPERRIHRLWLTESGKASLANTLVEAKEALLKRPDAKICERHELDRLTPPGSVHQGIVIETEPLVEAPLYDLINGDNPPDLIIMLDQVTDPHNVGAILRSASAFGAGAVILTERNAPSTTGVLAKTASGAVEHTPQIHVVNLARALDELQEAGYWRCGLAEEGTKDLSEMDLSGRTVLVMGNEGEGLRQLTRKKCDELARLPTGGAIGSLNVSNAAAVALYEVRRQKKKF